MVDTVQSIITKVVQAVMATSTAPTAILGYDAPLEADKVELQVVDKVEHVTFFVKSVQMKHHTLHQQLTVVEGMVVM